MIPFTPEVETKLMAAVQTIAADVILPRFHALGDSRIDAKENVDDVVTIADRESEARIQEVVATLLPGALTVGEEAVSDGRTDLNGLGTADLAVIVDPVDGTWNFANGIGAFGVILAVVARGQTIWGGIHDPLGQDWITARKGEGAWITRHGQKTPAKATGGPTTLADAHAHLPAFYFAPEKRGGIIDSYHAVRRFSHLGCSALEYRTVAQGSVDLSLSGGIKPWDHAAGALIVEEAGGVSRLLDGTPYKPTAQSGHLLVARNEALWHAAARHYAFLV